MTPSDSPPSHGHLHAGPVKCGAKNRQGGTCGQRAGWGTNHVGQGRCKMHGGLTPGAVARGERDAAARAVATFGLPRSVDPHTALIEELHRTAGHVAWLSEKLAGGETDDLIQEEGGGDFTRAYDRPSVWLSIYHEERAHLAKVAKTCHDVGIEERRVQLVEDAGRALAGFVRGLVADLGVADHPELWNIVRRRISEMPVIELNGGVGA